MRIFNPWRRAASPSFAAFVAETIEHLKRHEERTAPRTRRRKPAAESLFARQVEALLADLAHAQAQGQSELLIHRSKRYLGTPSRYRGSVETESLRRTLDLVATSPLGLAALNTGSVVGRQLSTVRPGLAIERSGWTFDDVRRELGDEVLILKAPRVGRREAEVVDYRDNDHTHALRAEVAAVSSWLEALPLRCTSSKQDTADRHMRRIFNNGAFNQGGRLYGGFWQTMTKAERFDTIALDSEPVAEIDYRQMHLRMLYAMARRSPPPGDLYSLPELEQWREGVKRVANSMLFKPGAITRFPAGTRSLFPSGLGAAGIHKAICQYHAPIAHAFGSGVGFSLMFHESEILLAVLRECRSQSLPALPIHDALLVPRSRAGQAVAIMEQAFGERFGVMEADGAVEVRAPPRPLLLPPPPS